MVTTEAMRDLTAFLKDRTYGRRSRMEVRVSLIVDVSERLARRC